MGKLDDVALADASVVHVPTSKLTHKQASDFKILIGCKEGRRKLLLWLMHNDPLVDRAYHMATNEMTNDSSGDVNEAVVIILANALKNIQCLHS